MLARRTWRHIPLLILALAVLVRVADPPVVERLRLAAFDEFQKLRPRAYVDAPVRIVDIDEQSIARLGQWPWPRTRLAALVARLGELGAAAVAFDVLFAEPDRTSPTQVAETWGPGMDDGRRAELVRLLRHLPGHDELLAQAFGATPTVLGMMLTDDQTPRERPAIRWGIAVAGEDPRSFLTTFGGSVRNLPVLEAAATGSGSFNSSVDRDGIIRRLPVMLRLSGGMSVSNEVYPSLAAEALRVAQGASAYVVRTAGAAGATAFGESTGLTNIRIGRIDVPTDSRGHLWLRDSGHVPQRFVPVWRLFEPGFDPAPITGHIVLVGTSAAGLRDLRTTPLSPNVAGVEIHAQALEQMILGVHLQRPDWMTGAEIAWLTILGLIIVLLIPRWGAAWCALLASGGIALAIGASWGAFDRLDWLVDPVYPSLAVLLLYLTQSLALFLRTEADRQNVRNAFGRYLSPALVERLARDPSLLTLGGETREMTIPFSDIRGFTAISETMAADELTRFMNAYLTPMTDIILSHGGTIDKYMGDAIMAFWNAPLDDPAHADNAARAALAMLAGLAELNATWHAEAAAAGRTRPPIAIGVGLNTGSCSVGNMGSSQRFDYSVLGDTANVASRLEGQSKAYGVVIVAGEATVAQAPGHAWLELDLVRVVGKSTPLRIYGLLGDATTAATSWFAATRDAQAEFLLAYRRADWEAADRALVRVREAAEGRLDGFAAMFSDRVGTLRKTPPADWDGVYAATYK